MMDESMLAALPPDAQSRRQLLTRLAMTAGGFAAGSVATAQTPGKAVSDPANKARTSLHMDVNLHAAPERLYAALLDAKQFAAFSGLPAEIDPGVGEAFLMFKGQIEGRNVELVPGQRIVQAWRPAHWGAGVYSMVKFEFKPDASGTAVALDHTGFPAGEYDSLLWGWGSHYWEPLKKYFA